MMKRSQWTIGCFALLAFASSALAASVNDRSRWTSVDKIRETFNNPKSPGRKVEMPTVDMKGAEIKGREVPMRELSTRPAPGMREVTTVDQKNVELKRRDVSTYDTAVRGTSVNNFTAKRAPVSEKMRPDTAKMYATDSAPIPSRRIVVASPEGLEELRKQLNRVP
jgi:hypothetical protein